MGDNWSPKKTAHMNSLPNVTTITIAPVIFYFIAFSNLPSAYRWLFGCEMFYLGLCVGLLGHQLVVLLWKVVKP